MTTRVRQTPKMDLEYVHCHMMRSSGLEKEDFLLSPTIDSAEAMPPSSLLASRFLQVTRLERKFKENQKFWLFLKNV